MQRRLALMLLLTLAATASAQDSRPEPQTGSVTVKLINGTSGQPGDAERVELREMGAEMRLVASAENIAGDVTFPGVDLVPSRPYVAVARRDGVDYRAQQVGQAFLAGEAVTVHVFDQTGSLEGVSVSGLNVVVRRQMSGCDLEYVLTIENAARPQRTIAAAALPVRLAMPDLTAATAEVYRGPAPEAVELATALDGLTGARVALVPGKTRIVLKGYWDVAGPASLEIGGNLPIAAWNLMVSPATLAVVAPDLDRDAGDHPGFANLRGPALAAGERLRVGLPVLMDDLASAALGGQAAPSDRATTRARPSAEGGSGPRWFWGVGAVVSVLLVGYGLWQRRR